MNKLDDDDEESIPIVPITPDQECAIEDENIMLLMLSLGIKKPSNEQVRGTYQRRWGSGARGDHVCVRA